MKEQIDRNLRQLVGLKLTRSTRAANMECFKFGHRLELNKANQEIEVGEFALHLQCPWRFTSIDKILVASLDLYEPAEENTEFNQNFDWDRPNGNLRDIKLQLLIEKEELLVNSVIADSFGGFDLVFNDDIKLTAFPCVTKNSDYYEFWRLLNNKDKKKRHFVISTSSLQYE